MATVSLRDINATYNLMTVRDFNLKRRIVDLASRHHEAPSVIQALHGVTLTLERGARIGLVGANGAGKSTLLAVMAGLLPPTSGSVRVEGRVLALLGGAGAGLDQEASGRANIISMGVQLGELPSGMRARVDDVVEFSGLGGRIDHPVYSYSTGMQARLRFSILTALRPEVLLIDEGIGTADAEFTQRANRRLTEFMAGAGILVIASHGDSLLQEQCSRAIWLDRGAVRTIDSVDSVLRDYHESYAVPEATV